MKRRLLTPAEAGLLLAPGAATAAGCIQAGLLSLLDAGRIEFEPSSSPFKQSALRLSPRSDGSGEPLPSHLAALERALAEYGKGDRLVATQVVHALQKRFGYGYGRYVHDELAPGSSNGTCSLVRTISGSGSSTESGIAAPPAAMHSPLRSSG